METQSSGGIGFVGLLTIVFIVLKLCNVIKWSWIWVLSPLWISAIIAIFVLLICLIIGLLIARLK
jgi:glucan phosphoethanolaminetransferase (alkaline phosphatase superfamily)